MKLRAAGRLDDAIDAYRSIVATNPADRIAWHNLAAALGDTGRFGAAESACRRAQELGLDAGETWLVLGRALQAQQRLDEAEAALTHAIDKRPDDAAAQRDFAQLVWMRTGNADTALERFRHTLARSPGNLNLQLTFARVLGQVGLADEGLQYAGQAAALAPGSEIVQTAAAYAASAASQPDQALGFARAALALAPQHKPAGMAEVQALLAMGDARTADVRTQALRQQDPHDQFLVAMQTTAWRLLGDERYAAMCDYTKLVDAYPLSAPTGWHSPEQYLSDVVEALDELHPFDAHPFDQSVKDAGSQITHIERFDDHPALKAWPHAVLPALRAYLDGNDLAGPLRSEADTALIKRFQTWSVRLLQSGRHTDHVHPNGIVSSACHLSTPAGLMHGPAGWLRFGKPGIATEPDLEAEYHLRPEPGMMVFFPSYIWHGVTPFAGDGTRLTVAMDVAQT